MIFDELQLSFNTTALINHGLITIVIMMILNHKIHDDFESQNFKFQERNEASDNQQKYFLHKLLYLTWESI